MLTEKMTYTVSAVTPNTQVGDIVYVKELDSGAHAIGEVDRIYAHGVHMDLYMAKREIPLRFHAGCIRNFSICTWQLPMKLRTHRTRRIHRAVHSEL